MCIVMIKYLDFILFHPQTIVTMKSYTPYNMSRRADHRLLEGI